MSCFSVKLVVTNSAVETHPSGFRPRESQSQWVTSSSTRSQPLRQLLPSLTPTDTSATSSLQLPYPSQFPPITPRTRFLQTPHPLFRYIGNCTDRDRDRARFGSICLREPIGGGGDPTNLTIQENEDSAMWGGSNPLVGTGERSGFPIE